MCAIMRLFFFNQEIVAVALWATRTLPTGKRLQCLRDVCHERLRGFLRSLRSRRVVSSRVILLDATSITNCSHSLIGNFLLGRRPFSSRKTRHAASAVRLLPSRKG